MLNREERQQLISLYNGGATLRELARKFKISQSWTWKIIKKNAPGATLRRGERGSGKSTIRETLGDQQKIARAWTPYEHLLADGR